VTEDFAPEPGRSDRLEDGLRRVLAPNPSAMTFRGTNTYLLGEGEVAVIDPGPDDPRHLAAILAALEPGERISHIFVTHAHLDHAPLARTLAQRTGAPVLAHGDAQAGRSAEMEALAQRVGIGGGEGVDRAFLPDTVLADDTVIEGSGWQLRAIWTPGHFGNHLSFQWEDRVFSGDHVMGWASSLVSPPDGDMAAYMRSLDRLQMLDARVLHPGHGAPVTSPAARISALRAHRRNREAMIVAALGTTPRTIAEIADQVYADTPRHLRAAAERNLFAHLMDLSSRGLARPLGELTPQTRFLGT
jgi:glyoxylase-like metal-dependent hydrolase (beta-lactamase superfamily II)